MLILHILRSAVLNHILRIYLIWIKNDKNIRMRDIINTAVMQVFKTPMIGFLEMRSSNNWFSSHHPSQKYNFSFSRVYMLCFPTINRQWFRAALTVSVCICCIFGKINSYVKKKKLRSAEKKKDRNGEELEIQICTFIKTMNLPLPYVLPCCPANRTSKLYLQI